MNDLRQTSAETKQNLHLYYLSDDLQAEADVENHLRMCLTLFMCLSVFLNYEPRSVAKDFRQTHTSVHLRQFVLELLQFQIQSSAETKHGKFQYNMKAFFLRTL